ncbi:hypothetical protein [Mesorhizobium sp. A556]
MAFIKMTGDRRKARAASSPGFLNFFTLADLTSPLRALAIMFYSCQLNPLRFDAVGSREQNIHYLGFCPASGVSGNCSQVINDCWHYLSCICWFVVCEFLDRTQPLPFIEYSSSHLHDAVRCDHVPAAVSDLDRSASSNWRLAAIAIPHQHSERSARRGSRRLCAANSVRPKSHIAFLCLAALLIDCAAMDRDCGAVAVSECRP